MLLVMFVDAVSHVARISRIIRQPLGNGASRCCDSHPQPSRLQPSRLQPSRLQPSRLQPSRAQPMARLNRWPD
eukprot:1457818-Prymnesium_polylepis.1